MYFASIFSIPTHEFQNRNPEVKWEYWFFSIDKKIWRSPQSTFDSRSIFPQGIFKFCMPIPRVLLQQSSYQSDQVLICIFCYPISLWVIIWGKLGNDFVFKCPLGQEYRCQSRPIITHKGKRHFESINNVFFQKKMLPPKQCNFWMFLLPSIVYINL